MLGHINTCDIGNLLYLKTKHYIKEDTTKSHFLVKFEKKVKQIL